MNTIRAILLCLTSTLAASVLITACAQSASEDGGPHGPLNFESSASVENLSATEWSEYRAAQEYINGIVPMLTPVAFNHADDQQHRFVILRMKLMGKTAKNSPELYARLKSLRSQHKALGVSPGLLMAVENDDEHSTQHFFSSVDILSDGVTQEVLCTLSAKESTNYSFADCGSWDANGVPIGNLVWTESYGSMPFTTLTTFGDLNLTALNELEADSYVYQDLSVSSVKSGGGIRESYIRTPQRIGPQFDSPVVDAPKNAVGGACTSVCLSRTWTGDCDYNLTGYNELKLPLKGCVNLANQSKGAYSFDPVRIAEYATGTATDSNGKATYGGRISVVLADVGGGCNVNGFGQIDGDMASFWSSVSLSQNNDRLCWDMTGAAAMEFDDSCRQLQDRVELTMHLVLPWQHANGTTGGTNVSMTNNESSADKNIDCIKVTNSCLAAGTMVELADGQTTAIEHIASGQSVANPFSSSNALTVMDTAVGIEEVPMVRIVSESGHSVLLTEMHPVEVVGRGMIMAKYLAVGQTVMTKDGPSQLTAVTRESFDGKVHNLKVGSAREAQTLGADQTVFYANGILVGDGQIQSKYESLALAAKKPATVGSPHDSWKRDFKHSLRRQ